MAENVIANYEGYRAQVRSLVDEYVDEIDKGPNFVKHKKERHRDELSSFFLKELDAEKVMFYKADPFVDSLRFSKDPSTSKVGSLLLFLYEYYPSLYVYFINLIIDKTLLRNEDAVYYGRELDTFKYKSSEILIKKMMSVPGNEEMVQALLKEMVEGDNEFDVEFQCLYSFLSQYTNLPGLEMLGQMLSSFKECFETGSKENTVDNMRKLTLLIVKGGLSLQASDDSYFNLAGFRIGIDSNCYSGVAAFHELGHAVDAVFGYHGGRTPKVQQMYKNVREKIMSNPDSYSLIHEWIGPLYELRSRLETDFEVAMWDKFGSRFEMWDALQKYTEDFIKNGKIEDLLKEYGLSEKTIKSLMDDFNNNRIDIGRLSYYLFKSIRDRAIDRIMSSIPELRFMDVLSNIFQDHELNFPDGNYIYLYNSHCKSYYRLSLLLDHSTAELVANFNALLMYGRTDLLDFIKELIGEELFNYIMDIHDRGRIIEDKSEQVEMGVLV